MNKLIHSVKTFRLGLAVIFAALLAANATAQTAAEVGSATARNGFLNETEIRDKFNNWKTDADAQAWLAAMSYNTREIESVIAAKPHGEKADVEVRIKTKLGEKTEGISIKLVSNVTGFNQIDKRWLAHYVKMWSIPTDVEAALKLFVGETPPNVTAKESNRIYLNELGADQQKAVIDFFAGKKEEIVSDLFQGDGVHAAGWVMVALKATSNTRWVIRSSADTIRYFSEGPVVLTRNGNLKIGRITMQRKGGDGGRDTAKMLQFKINPALLFDAK